MSAPDMTVSRLGLKTGGSDNTELFLKVYAGEVLTAFAQAAIMPGKHMERTISSGR